MQVSTVKWLAALCLFTVALTGGLLPFLLKQRSQRKRDRAKALAIANHAEPDTLAAQPRKRRNSLQYEDDDQALQSPVHSGSYAEPPAARIVVPSAIRVVGADSAATGLAPSASFLRSESLRTRHPEVLQRRAARKDSAAAPLMDSAAAAAASAPTAHHHRHHHSRCCHMDVDRFLSLGNMLGAGIFLGGGLMHLLPEGLLALNEQQQSWEGTSLDWLKSFPIACFLAGVGFFLILLVEEITLAVSARRRAKKERELALAKAQRRDEEVEEQAALAEQRKREREERKKRNNIAGASSVAAPSTPVSSSPVQSGSRRRRGRRVGGVGGGGRSASPSADWKHDLAQNILLGLNPRVMLLPAAPRVRTPKRKPRAIATAAASSPPAAASAAAAPSSPPAKPVADFVYSSESSLSDLEDAGGPIQQFLDAARDDSAYNSPSPFPTLADPLISRRLSKIHQRGRRGSFPPDDSDSNMKPMLRGSRGAAGAGGADSAYSDAESATPPLVGPATPTTAGYSASSRAGGASTNSAALRSGDTSPREADNKSAPPLTLSTSPFAVSAPPTPTSVASLRQPLLFVKPSAADQHLDASPSPPAASYSTFSQSFDPSASAAAEVVSASPPRRGKALSPHRSARRKRSTDVPHHHHDSADHGHDHAAAPAAPGHGHGHGHGSGEDGHSHVAIDAGTSYAVAYLLVLALSFHSVFEGIALGTQSLMGTTISIFIAILAHSPLAGFALGVSLVKARASPRMAVSCLVLFSSMTPLGCILGLALSYLLSGSTLTSVSACFQSFSAGTFLFVALEEIIPKELAAGPKDKPLKLALCVLGFMMMAAIKLVDTD